MCHVDSSVATATVADQHLVGLVQESWEVAANRFVFIENIVEDAEPAKGTVTKSESKRPPAEAIELIIRAMDKIDQEDDWYLLGLIGQRIVADNPDFDTRTYGKRKLSDLVAELKRFETKRVGNQLYVRRVD